MDKKVAAIVPAFNEGKRIKKVLNVLKRTDIIDEIIVVDDGSKDNTEKIVKKFNNIKYLKNTTNKGKAYTMNRGVESTDAQIIFFCDADLINVTPEIITNIIKPVVDDKFAMFIGLRSNFMQSAVRLFALNSGERAMKREVWETLPKKYMHKYRIEPGLNHHAKKFKNKFGFKEFEYSQHLKENKYGFFKGTMLRYMSAYDMTVAYIMNIIENLL